MLNTLKKRYSNYRFAIVGADFNSEGGAWRSVHKFYKHLDAKREPVLLVDLRRDDGWRRWICSILFAPSIIVNGMSAASNWGILLGMLLRKDIAVYLHDTTYMLDQLQKNRPLAYKALSRVLRSNPVLCVSEQMESLYRVRFGSKKTTVVYEVTDLEPDPVLEAGKKHIVMVGSLDRRKGYPLFLDVAKCAASEGLPWQFHWVGGLGEADLAPVSEIITWWGWKNSATPFLKQADAFFLSSLDDPQPLACLEALSHRRRCVVYRNVGSSEIVEALPGCSVYEEYTPEAAINSLKTALKESVCEKTVKQRLAEVAGVEQFHERIQRVF